MHLNKLYVIVPHLGLLAVQGVILVYIIIIMVELTGEGRAYIPEGLARTWDGLVN